MRILRRRILPALPLLALLFVGISQSPAQGAIQLQSVPPATFTVNSTGDSGDSNTADGLCKDSTGACTLRAAIQQANASAGKNTIAFNISGAGPHTIRPNSALPTITDPVIIDGFTQSGASPNTNPVGQGLNAVLKIELSGAGAGAGVNGLVISAGDSTMRGLVINRFSAGGIVLQTNGGNVIEGLFIGTDVTGSLDLGNSRDGIEISFGSNNIIGGTTAGARNIISGNDQIGVFIQGSLAASNSVQGNFIGTDVTGTIALGNTFSGVFVGGAPKNLIGGTTPGAGNVISGNAGPSNGVGVVIQGSEAMLNVVQGNLIGTDITGTIDLGNAFDGVSLESNATQNVIGGMEPGARNVISGNNRDGVFIQGVSIVSGDGNAVLGNFIGTDITGTLALGNSEDGVRIHSASNNTIGGTTSEARNVISSNKERGITIAQTAGGGRATGNLVQGNFIGTKVDGKSPLGNTSHGIFITNLAPEVLPASNNTIGGTTSGAGNTIAFSGGLGVSVISGTGNTIQGNSIHSNGGLGIDLGGDGVTPNDLGDADTGANNLQNFPVLTSALTTTEQTQIRGALNSTPNTQFKIEFFFNTVCDPSGHGEGESRVVAFGLNPITVTTDGGGNITFGLSTSATVPVGRFVTTTATDPNGNTSEFSRCIQVVSQAVTGTAVSGTVTLQGRTGTFPPGVGHSIATVTMSPGNVIANVAMDGTFQFANVSAGTVTFTASAPGYLSAQRVDVQVGSSAVVLPAVQLLMGKVNGDDAVDILDLSAVVQALGGSPQNRMDSQGNIVDQNGDGAVDVLDLSGVVSSLGRTSPQPWP
jgi:CSLREA domain-containing protein